jgi:hypothetical protein
MSSLPIGLSEFEIEQNWVFDVSIPSVSLALEYNGVQHYQSDTIFGSRELMRERDKVKRYENRIAIVCL